MHMLWIVVLVDPNQVPNKEAFDRKHYFDYKYYVIGGNNLVEAKIQLIEEYPGNYLFETMKCFIYVFLTETKGKVIGMKHNADNEYRISMTFIQMVIFIHNEFLEKCGGDKTKVSLSFRKECCMETSYQIEDKINSKGDKINSHLFRGMDNIFQLTFRIGEI